MKKDSIAKLQVTKSQVRRMAAKQRLTVGLDLGDRSSRYCILDEAGEKASEDQLPTNKAGLDSIFARMAPCRIAVWRSVCLNLVPRPAVSAGSCRHQAASRCSMTSARARGGSATL